MASVECMNDAPPPDRNVQRVGRSVHPGWISVLLITLFAVGLVANFVADAKPLPQSAMGISQIVSATGNWTPDDDRQLVCPVCGRLVCLVPDDLLAASPPDSALPPADAVPTPVIGCVRLPWARAPDAAVSIFLVSSFEPRGPPFVD